MSQTSRSALLLRLASRAAAPRGRILTHGYYAPKGQQPWTRLGTQPSHDAASSFRQGMTTSAAGFAASAADASTSGASAGASARTLLGYALLISPSAVCAFLYKWQLDRYEWKRGELDAREAALVAPDLTLRDIASMVDARTEPDEYARVLVEGTLDVGRTVKIRPRVRSVHGTPIPGSVVLTPCKPRRGKGGKTVIVNRGWAPDDWREPKGGVCLKTSGVVRRSETPSRFTPTNDPATDAWHWIDRAALCAAMNLPPDTQMVQLVHDGGKYAGNGFNARGKRPSGEGESAYPAPVALADLREFKVNPQDHVNYAATWGTLCVATGGLAAWAIRRPGAAARKAAKAL